ncbi:MAG: BlaI/MecI/CopY family transcriptional regulator [Bacteroidales bacterium]|nr:BlaI/MecI/CopY family transcriptional regulator [Bacteroidales bacterium]
MKELTKAEEQVMQILWKIEKGFVNDILEAMDAPKPAYNTVSTIVRILQKKGFVGHEPVGKSHRYYPLVTKEEYRKSFFSKLFRNYFSGSYKQLASFFAKDDSMSIQDLEAIKEMMEKEIERKRKNNE